VPAEWASFIEKNTQVLQEIIREPNPPKPYVKEVGMKRLILSAALLIRRSRLCVQQPIRRTKLHPPQLPPLPHRHRPRPINKY